MTNPHDLVLIDGQRIRTPRLLLRPWAVEDAATALSVFGDEQVGWLDVLVHNGSCMRISDGIAQLHE